MRPVSPIVSNDIAGLSRKVSELCLASQDVTEEVADPFTLANLTKQYALDVNTATIADVARVLATLINDLKQRGTHRVV